MVKHQDYSKELELLKSLPKARGSIVYILMCLSLVPYLLAYHTDDDEFTDAGVHHGHSFFVNSRSQCEMLILQHCLIYTATRRTVITVNSSFTTIFLRTECIKQKT